MAETEEPISKRVIVPMPETLIEEVNDYRFEERRGSQADAVRELIKLGLETWRQHPKKPRQPKEGKAK